MKVCTKENKYHPFELAHLYKELETGEIFIHVRYHEGLMNLQTGLIRLDPIPQEYTDVTDKYCFQEI